MLPLCTRPVGFGQTNQTQLLLHMEGSNGGTTFTDSSQNAFTVTPTSATTSTTQAKFGSTSGYFGSATSSRLSIADNTLLRAGSGFTIDCWAYLTDVTTAQYLITKQATGGATAYNFYVTAGQFAANVSDGGGSLIFATSSIGAISTNTWTHLALQWSGSRWDAFVNGVSGYTLNSSTAPYASTDAMLIGNVYYSGAYSYNAKGYIDEARFSTGAIFPTGGFVVPGNPYSTG